MARCHTNCIEKPVCIGFEKLGRFIGRNPWCFFVIPLLISAGLGGGFYFLKDREANDIENQFTPVNGPAKTERRFVQENFPQNYSEFSSQRLYTEGTFASVIAVSTGSSILTKEAFQEILDLDAEIKRMSVRADNGQFNYAHLCVRTKQKCVSNAILDIIDYNASKIEDIHLTFPIYILKSGFVFLGSTVGGVVTNGSLAESAKAIRLFYYLEENDVSGTLWLNEFLKVFSNSSTHRTFIKVSPFTSLSRQEEFEGNSKSVIPLFSITYFLAILFSIVSCLRFDCVRNKAWVASVGVISAGLAVLSGFGLLLCCGVPFAMTVANSPFLILGIGVDDMFIMISCWQQTRVCDSVEDRLARTYKEAAISITITTLTDVLAFYIGIMTPFRSVQSFCLYTGTTVLFCYFYNITFFGAFLALNGRREESNRHWLSCRKVPEVCPQGRSKAYSLCCVGGAYDSQTGCEEEQPMSHFFRKYYGPFLTNTWTKVFVVLLYGVYLGTSIYGCLQLKEGIDLRNLASDGSYVVNYYDDEEKYFSKYGPNVMVVVKENVAYWNETIHIDLKACMKDFKNLTFIDGTVVTSWLQMYETMFSSVDFNDKRAFMGNLTSFLNVKPEFKQDLNISQGNIYASRFFVQTVNISTAVDEKNMLNKLRETAQNCKVPLLVYHPAFIYYDQYAVIVSTTVQNIVVATAVMLVISLLLIPNPLCSLWVTFAIGSVIVGVAGFMALWQVNLDSISMINLVICIGFSVDFSAHISYAFVSNRNDNVNAKAIDSLFVLGYPIVQGAASTVLGVVALAAAESYIFRTFFKIMFLVILFGAAHGIVFLPVFLTFFGICSNKGEISTDHDKKSHCATGGGAQVTRKDNDLVHKQEMGLSFKDQSPEMYTNHGADLMDCP
ncbi:patched domain-containing protein 3-like isoform X1 [Lepisosteus oculatus]|uniref:patched domain-containing protein 3-like isoform X1 n=1 Tax=Lepisosteus oculatus TaxID=7918 RepID=UPI0037125AAD